MLVDRILEYYGDSSIVYVDNQDKWIGAFSHIFVSSFIYSPIICTFIPIIYLLVRRQKYSKKDFRKKLVKYALVGFAIGIFLPYAIIVISAGLAQRDLYGG